MNIKNVVVGLFALGVGIGSYFAGVSALDADKKYERLFEEGKKPIVGIVLEESYQNTLSSAPKWDGIVSYSNETVKLESKYTLKLQTDEGKIVGVSVIDGEIKKESIEAIIEKGTRISFPVGNMKHGNWYMGSESRVYPNETYFTPETQAGNKRADRIKILPKE